MSACRKSCQYLNSGGCDLTSDKSQQFIEELMNADAQVLTAFLLKHECDGDFKSMIKKEPKPVR
jgi:hypothetical protein